MPTETFVGVHSRALASQQYAPPPPPAPGRRSTATAAHHHRETVARRGKCEARRLADGNVSASTSAATHHNACTRAHACTCKHAHQRRQHVSHTELRCCARLQAKGVSTHVLHIHDRRDVVQSASDPASRCQRELVRASPNTTPQHWHCARTSRCRQQRCRGHEYGGRGQQRARKVRRSSNRGRSCYSRSCWCCPCCC